MPARTKYRLVGRLLSAPAEKGKKDPGTRGNDWELQGKVWTGWGSKYQNESQINAMNKAQLRKGPFNFFFFEA